MRILWMLLMICLMASGLQAGAEDGAETAAVQSLTKELPEGCTLLDGCMFDETAMLLFADAGGSVCFAGCVRSGTGWEVSLSAAFPAWMDPALDTYHAGDGSMRLWTSPPSGQPLIENAGGFTFADEGLDVYIGLTAAGRWQVWGVNNGWDVIEFCRHGVRNMNFDYFGDFPLPLDVTRIDWAALPRSFDQAMALTDTSRWRIIASRYAPVYDTEAGRQIIALGAAGAPVRVLSAGEDLVQVQFIGRHDPVWMHAEDLLPGDAQALRYEAWLEDGNAGVLEQIILEDTDPTVSWYAAPHDDSTAVPFEVDAVEYVTVLGWCRDTCCCLLYSETLGSTAYVPLRQLGAEAAGRLQFKTQPNGL